MKYVISKKEKDLQKQLDDVKQHLLIEQRKRKIACGKCNKLMQIGKLDIVDVEGYVAPYSCTGGDYWTHSYYEFECPHCKATYRLSPSSFQWKEEDGEHYWRQVFYNWIENNLGYAKSCKTEKRQSKW